MKKILTWGVMVLLLIVSGHVSAAEQDDIAKHPECIYCGMNRGTFAHSRMQVIYQDGSVLNTCSVHCTAVDLAMFIDKSPVSFNVGDFKTKKLIDAEKAFWVLGGDKPGVMTKRAKWAFENKSDADQFISEHGGTAITFEQALESTYEDMYKDTRMIREKRKMKREKMMQKKE